jgi:LysM repeat protein
VTGRSPARLLAPLALVAVAVALYAVVSSDRGDSGTSTSGGTPTPTATATPTSTKKSTPAGRAKTYTVKAGDTPSGIAEALNVSVNDLLAANPDADPRALSPGDKLKLP